MIDIHLYILPDIDDDPATLQESLALAQVLVREDIHSAVETAHYNDEFVSRPAVEIKEHVYE